MSNLNGPKSSKRKLLMSVTHYILLYGAEIWGEALGKDIYAKGMIRVQRQGALRVVSETLTRSKRMLGELRCWNGRHFGRTAQTAHGPGAS